MDNKCVNTLFFMYSFPLKNLIKKIDKNLSDTNLLNTNEIVKILSMKLVSII